MIKLHKYPRSSFAKAVQTFYISNQKNFKIVVVIVISILGYIWYSRGNRSTKPITKHNSWVEASSEPRIYVQDEFFSREEATYVLEHCGLGRFSKGNIVAPTIQRNSSTAFCKNDFKETEKIQELLHRIHVAARLPNTKLGETIQLGHYANEYEFYKFHYDSGGPGRFVTVFVYLNDCEFGGETIFPFAKGKMDIDGFREVLKLEGDAFREFCRTRIDDVLAVRPRMGRAIMFFNHDSTLMFEKRSLHAGCPPLNGEEKYFMTRWIRNYERNPKSGAHEEKPQESNLKF